MDTAIAPQLIFATFIRLKSVSAHGYRQLFKKNNIADLIISRLSTLTFYCFVALLASHTKTVTLYTAYALGLAISFVMILETYSTIYVIMKRLESTLERIRTIAAYLFCATGPLGPVVFPFGMIPGFDLGHEYSLRADYMQQEEDKAAREQQHRKERATSETKVQLYNDLFPENQYALKSDKTTNRRQENIIPYVLTATLQHESFKAHPATYKAVTPDLNTGQESSMKTGGDYFSPTAPEMQPRESTFQMTLRKSMHRSKRPRTRSRMSNSVKECSSEDSNLKEGFRMTVWLENEASGDNSGTSTPDSESSTPESDFQAGLRMMFRSVSGKTRRRRRGRKSGPSIIESECSSQESEFQTKFREAVWPRSSNKRRTGTPGRETSSEESDFQANFRAMMGLDGRKRKIF